MFVVYAIFIHLIFLLALPVLLLHPKLREGFWFRLGFYPKNWPLLKQRPVIWFHGASAGDLIALRPVILEVRAMKPEISVVLTCITNSGMAVASQGMPGVDAVGYLPFDLPWAVGRAVKTIRPDVLVLEYAEVWPSLIRRVSRFGARIVITNGRFNPRALGRYRWLYRLIGNPLRRVDRLCMREDEEAKHVLALGADPARVLVTGNTKFDGCRTPIHGSGAKTESKTDDLLDELRQALGLDGQQPVWVCGSTHDGEEGPLLDVYLAVRKQFPSLRLIFAPRYLERVEKVASLVRERSLTCGFRSRGQGPAPVMILDSVGELRHCYCLATVVFVGGSFVSRGGQNILEPAACQKPVLFGPFMDNFADSVRVLVGRGGIQVPDKRRLERTLVDLLSNPAEADKLGKMAFDAVMAVQGASKKNAQIILSLAAAPESKA